MADSDPYSYDSLEDEDVKKAKKELKEEPEKVPAQIASLRRWVHSMRHLTCRTDDVFLLRFLRVAKFEQARAQQMLDNFCTVRASPRGCPNWFNPMPIDSPQMQAFLKMPLVVVLGQNDLGEVILYASTANFNHELMPVEEFIRCGYMRNECILSMEKATIHGIRFVSDLKGTTMRHFEMFANPKITCQMIRNMQDAMPLRVKALVYFNEPPYLDLLLGLSMPLMKEKLKKRVFRCGSDLQKLRKAIGPGAERLLPAELGGSNKPLAQLIDDYNAIFLGDSAAQEREVLAGIRVDESLRQPDTKDYLRCFDNATDAPMGLTGTFTKLNVD